MYYNKEKLENYRVNREKHYKQQVEGNKGKIIPRKPRFVTPKQKINETLEK